MYRRRDKLHPMKDVYEANLSKTDHLRRYFFPIDIIINQNEH